MRVRQFAHLALAALLLVQTVSTLAGAMWAPGPAGSVAAADTAATGGDEHGGESPGCHEAVKEPAPAALPDCCDAMDRSCCKLGCAAPVTAPAIPAGAPTSFQTGDPAQFTAYAVVRPDDRPSQHFRPPRSH